MARTPVVIPSSWDLEWTAIPTGVDDNVGGPAVKLLTEDPVSGATTMLIHCPPGWIDPRLDWHPHDEEVFFLAGCVQLRDRYYRRGDYLYRPPGILHGEPAAAPELDGATTFHRFDSPLRILRYDGDEFPQRDSVPITAQHETWPIPWLEHVKGAEVPWREVAAGGWAGARAQELARNRVNGGGAWLLELPAGWEGRGSTASGPVEEFVVEGSVVSGRDALGLWGYAARPRGEGACASETGALLLLFSDEPELG